MEEPIRLLHLVIATVLVCLACIGAGWGMIVAHAENPHPGAVTQREIDQLRVTITEEHRAIRAELALLRAAVLEHLTRDRKEER